MTNNIKIIFRNSKYYAYDNSSDNWKEYNLKTNAFGKNASKDIQISILKDSLNGRIVEYNNVYYVYNNNFITGNKWKVWSDTSKKGTKIAPKTIQNELNNILQQQNKTLESNENHGKNLDNNSRKFSERVLKTINFQNSVLSLNRNNTTNIIPNENSSAEKIHLNTENNYQQSNIASQNLLAKTIKNIGKNIVDDNDSTDISDTKKLKKKSKISGKVINFENPFSSIIKNDSLRNDIGNINVGKSDSSFEKINKQFHGDQQSNSSQNSLLNIFKNIDKNTSGISTTLKSINKLLSNFLDQQKKLQQIAENFANAIPKDEQKNSKTDEKLEKIYNVLKEKLDNMGSDDNISNDSDDNGGFDLGSSLGRSSKTKKPSGKSAKKPSKSLKTPKTASKIPKSGGKLGSKLGKFGKLGSKLGKISGKVGRFGGTIGSMGKALGGGLMSLGGGMLLDYGSEKAEEKGYKKLSGGLDIASNTLSGASLGGMIGSAFGGIGAVPGAAIGGVIGGGIGVVNNISKFFNGEEDGSSMTKKRLLEILKEKKDNKENIQSTKRAKELADQLGLDVGDKPEFVTENGIPTKVKDKHGKEFNVYQQLRPEEKELVKESLNKKGMVENAFSPKDKKDEENIKQPFNEKDFAAKKPREFQDFVNYREQKRQEYINQIPQGIDENTRQNQVMRAQEKAQKDAEKKYENDISGKTATKQEQRQEIPVKQEQKSEPKTATRQEQRQEIPVKQEQKSEPKTATRQEQRQEIPSKEQETTTEYDNSSYNSKEFEKGLGDLSGKYEGKYGTVSSGVGDPGGISYGKYQFASKGGGLQKFMKVNPEYAKEFSGLRPGSSEFGAKWKELSKTEGFQQAQEKAAQEHWYKPAAEKANELGYKMDNRGVREAVFSGSIQHGGIKKLLKNVADKNPNFKNMTPEEQLKAYYEYRESYAVKNAPKVASGLRKRYKSELNDAIKYSKKSDTPKQNNNVESEFALKKKKSTTPEKSNTPPIEIQPKKATQESVPNLKEPEQETATQVNNNSNFNVGNIPNQFTQSSSYTPVMPSNIGMNPTMSGESLSVGSASVASAKDSLSIPMPTPSMGGTAGNKGSASVGSGGNKGSAGGGHHTSSEENSDNIMGIAIGLRNEEPVLTKAQFSIIRIV